MDNTQLLNQAFVKKITSIDNNVVEKLAQDTALFIRQKMREVSFARQILPPIPITPMECQTNVKNDQLVKIEEIEPDSKALIVNLRGNPNTVYVRGQKFEIPFFTIESEEAQKTEKELRAYTMPIIEVIQKNTVFDIQKVEDEAFLTHVDLAINISEADKAGSKLVTGTFDTDGSIKKKDLVSLFDTLDGDSLRTTTLLMSSTMYNKFLLYNATTIGDQAASSAFIDGLTFSNLMGKRVIISNKVDLLGNNIYAFTDPSYFGKFYILDDLQFFTDKKKNIISWSAQEEVGMGIGNTRAVGKLTLS